MSYENRQAVRYNVDTAAEVYTPSGVFPARTRNLSATGVCFDLSYELPEDTVVGISLFLTTDGIEDPDAEPLNIKAKVIWTSPREGTGFSAGMRFENVAGEEQSALDTFLAQLS